MQMSIDVIINDIPFSYDSTIIKKKLEESTIQQLMINKIKLTLIAN